MFWERLIKICNERGTSPTAVVKALKISGGSVTKWKNGSIPNDTTLLKLADYFGVSVEYLKGESKSPRRIKKIPVLGNVAAGVPIEAIEEWDDWEEIDEDQYPAGEYIALRIHGDSMEPKFSEGDVVIVQYGNPCESGDIAIVMVNGSEATCKKIKFMPEGIFLISLNPEYEPMFFSAKEVVELPVRVLGKVVELRAKF